MNIKQLKSEVIALLQELIATPSFSREESEVADIMEDWLKNRGFEVLRSGNNVWVHSIHSRVGKKVLLLNSHIDTVKPASGYTRDPFSADIEDGLLYGLGSNDAGGPLVALLAAFVVLSAKNQPYHLIFAATAEEEVSGKNGVESILNELGTIDFAVVGEPTQMQMAVAEKGLLVLDCYSEGVSGHAARNEGVNAIYKALDDVEWFRKHQFEKQTDFLGPVKMTVTQINAGTQHNVVPDSCHFVVDVRLNECYDNVEILNEIRDSVSCRVEPRSLRLNSSVTPANHPFVTKGMAKGIGCYGSPTTSDQALMPFTTVKMGPGDSARSHTADEYVGVDEIHDAIDIYVAILDGLEI